MRKNAESDDPRGFRLSWFNRPRRTIGNPHLQNVVGIGIREKSTTTTMTDL